MAESTGTKQRSTRGKQPAPAEDRPKRGNGTGSVYPYTRGGYVAAFTWRDDSGVRHRRTVSAPTRDAADRALARMRDDHDAGRLASDPGTVEGYLARWLETSKQDVRPSTWRQREGSIRAYVIPALGRIRLARLAPSDVEGMTAGIIASGLSPTTAAHARVILRRALADAQRDGLVARNVAGLARPPRLERRELEYLDAAQLRKLLDGTAADDLGPLLAVAATTGLRQGELLGLRWQDVDTKARTLTVRRAMARAWDGGFRLAEPKTARSRRTIDLPTRAVVALGVERGRQDVRREALGEGDWQDRDGLVFTDAAGRPLVGSNVTHRFRGRLVALKLPKVPFHALRHSAASALLAAGVPLKVVSETLGHSTITITADLYAHVAPTLRRDAADAMDRALA